MSPMASISPTRGMIRRRAIGLLLAAGASPASAKPDPAWSLERPYVPKGTGIGGGDVVGFIVIPGGAQGAVASRALVVALQDMGLSVVTPKVGVDGLLPPLKPWSTDIAPLDGKMIQDYNHDHPTLALPPAHYGVSYGGVFDTSAGKLRYRLSAKLHQRGALSHWSDVAQDKYFGNFFVAALATRISQTLDKASAA